MKVLMISGSPFLGGAEIAARRIAEGLHTIGCEVIFVTTCNQEMPNTHFTKIDYPYRGMKIQILKNLKYISYPAAFTYNTRFAIKFFKRLLSEIKPDIINVHNIKQAFWGPDIVGLCVEYAPTVWTLHDMSSFTGRCIHALDCEGYLTGCGESCQSRHIPFIIPRSLTQKRWRDNKTVIDSHPDLVAVCPSQWLANKAKNSSWIKNWVEVIPNGIDLSLFTPIQMKKAREKLGLPGNGLLFLMVAMDINSRLKGGLLLQKALELVTQKHFSLITVGGKKTYSSFKNSEIEMYSLGHIESGMMPYVYSAANLLIHPSIADTLPNVIIEAMACGTPAIGFDVGGIPEIIQDGVNGMIVKETSSSDLAYALDYIQKDSILLDQNSRRVCRESVEKQYNYLNQGKKYKQLFNSMINSAPL